MTSAANAVLTGIYTLTSTHCGTGQSSGAVDLPIARESTTLLPILPATSLKGVARDAISGHQSGTKRGEDADRLDWMFGPELNAGGNGDQERAQGKAPYGAGALVFGEGFLLAWPLRSLNRPLLFGTSLLLIERWSRICRAHGLAPPVPWTDQHWTELDRSAGAVVAEAGLAGQPLVVEDAVLDRDQVRSSPSLDVLGTALASLLPAGETRTAERLKRNLVLLPDRLLLDLLEHAPPVTARTQLTSAKTTSKVELESGTESGNLWYEETLPPDCLFGCVVAARVGARHPVHGDPVPKFVEQAKDRLRHVQIGGNETVGHGRCWWTVGGTT
jgi:CRISPR-associated protein Cmr4